MQLQRRAEFYNFVNGVSTGRMQRHGHKDYPSIPQGDLRVSLDKALASISPQVAQLALSWGRVYGLARRAQATGNKQHADQPNRCQRRAQAADASGRSSFLPSRGAGRWPGSCRHKSRRSRL